MYYLISNCDCKICDVNVDLKANVPYCLAELDNKDMCCLTERANPLYINFYEEYLCFATKKYNLANYPIGQNQLVCFEHGVDKYLFIFFYKTSEPDFRCFEFLNKQIFVANFGKLIINYDGEQIVNKRITNIAFSHYEIEGEFCYLFFAGVRNYVVVLNKSGLVWADYYDEYNCEKEERHILKHMQDCLNHGKVLSIKQNKTETYLVYLDDYELKLKPEFLALVFMDCLVAENYKYCAKLVDKNLNFDEKTIKEFFPDFDSFFPMSAKSVALFKKNALVGICDFEILDDIIVNIIIN